ncbi:Hypothetical protein UVM_LOCUS44 [uncultured virus]|nr:Hypothetical protein UVM_LOCUS44 [uncultured virus]
MRRSGRCGVRSGGTLRRCHYAARDKLLVDPMAFWERRRRGNHGIVMEFFHEGRCEVCGSSRPFNKSSRKVKGTAKARSRAHDFEDER